MDQLYPANDILKLPIHERVAATLLIITVLMFTAVNLYIDEGEMPQIKETVIPLTPPYIEVSISGAVAKPGNYQVLKGTTVEELLLQAEPLESANLKSLKMDSKIMRRRKIEVKELKRVNTKNLRRKEREG